MPPDWRAAADATVVMDGDLQDPPELIAEMVACWRAGAEVVRAERRTRQERGVRRWSFALFHGLFGWLADFPIPAHVGVFGLLDRKALDELNRLPEKNRFLPGLRAWVGFEQRADLLRPGRARLRTAETELRPARVDTRSTASSAFRTSRSG